MPVARFLLAGELAQGVVSDGGVVAGHAQGAAPLAGHAGESLPPREVIHRHHIKAHPFPPRRRLVLSEDGGGCGVEGEIRLVMCLSGWVGGLWRSLRVNAVLEEGLRLSQLSALSLLEMSSSESLGVEKGELLSTSSYLRLRPRDEPASMETRCLRGHRRRTSRVRCD